MTVDEFVRREASLPPYPGACCRMVDKWIFERTGFSALSKFGRDFDNDQDVKSWLAEPGGIAVAVNRVMKAAGIPKTKDPAKGDVGLVFQRQDDGQPRLCMGLHTGRSWMSRDETSLIGIRLDLVWKAWRIPNGREDY